ncbi:hypothetical protein FRB91_011711 [Serendipita sp. 411]|nr:hypothetical protein FRC18_005680 [Serendipita sp. 400]KAG8821767.1 hypothetical protein FRC19_007279 [Serendipita sp. 401]KAG8847518.1 hypothetical protein FRB91_011711 [Serendipita sp. 411]KAG9052002.1 hypothetical protein FS842_010644 [Serendipita sp. 407]
MVPNWKLRDGTERCPFKNRSIRAHDFYLCQKEIRTTLESEIGQKLDLDDVDVLELKKKSGEGLARGDFTDKTIYRLTKSYVLGPNASGAWGENDDSEAVGLPKREFKTVIKEVVSSFGTK